MGGARELDVADVSRALGVGGVEFIAVTSLVTPSIGVGCLVCLVQGALTLAGVTSRDCRALLDGADAVLGCTATDPAGTSRDTVFHVAWLARAHVAAGDLDRAVSAGLTALRRLPTVRSRRCALVLRRLEADLAALPPTHRPLPR